MKKNLKSFLSAVGLLALAALGAGSARATPVAADPALSVIYNPALSLPGLPTITVTPNTYIKSLSEFKDNWDVSFGPGLGDDKVKAAMESSYWFYKTVTLISDPTSGNCNTGFVTCVDDNTHPKSGTYAGLIESLADNGNLFVVHVGGSQGGSILAFLYSSYINDFSISGFANGVSWIRAYRVPGALQGGPVVPLPAGFLLLLSGLGGLGYVARLRKAKVVG